MAFAVVNALSALWLRRGLAALLLPADVPLPLPAEPAKKTAPPAPGRQTARRPPDSATNRQQPASLGREVWRPLPPEAWPLPWRERFAATRPGLVVWTYWNLGRDLYVAPDAARRDFFRKLLADLRHPSGTHTFWPPCLPAGEADSETKFAPNAEVFWSGARRLGARGVVVMGSAAAAALALPGNPRPLSQMRYREQSVCVLNDVDNLLHEEKRYAGMLAFLRSALRSVANARALT
ncbi:MAG: hypothetical protein LBB60_11530 [Desulfovibrio sp.]|jgi:hypothetical protein|nr:hypothetical protein [Desulfovibrio sp.]